MERDFSPKTAVLTCLPYTQDDRSGCNITKSLDLSTLLRCFDLRQKKNICKFRLRFFKSVQTFHAKVVCPTFRDRPLSKVAIQISASSPRTFSLTTAMQILSFELFLCYFLSVCNMPAKERQALPFV